MKSFRYFLCAFFVVTSTKLFAVCATTEVSASAVRYKIAQLPIELSGFFPYVLSGSGAPKKYTTESWSGTGEAETWPCGCHNWYDDMEWSGAWTFSTSDFTDSSTKALSYTASGCGYPSGPEAETQSNLKVNLTAPTGNITSPGTTSQSATSQSYVNGDPVDLPDCLPGAIGFGNADITETLSNEFTHAQAKTRAESHLTVIDNSGNLQHWDNDYPATEDQAASLLGSGTITRTTPVVCHAERVSFCATFSFPCPGRYLITMYYKKWAIGDPEPSGYEIRTQQVTFKDAPFVFPTEGGYRTYDIELEQGQQCKLDKITALNLDATCSGGPGAPEMHNNSVESFFSLGRLTEGISAGRLALAASTVTADLYSPAALQLQSPDSPEIETLTASGALRQIVSPECVADIITLTGDSYEIRFYHAAQKDSFNSSTGVYDLTGSPYVTYTVENPDTLVTHRLQITETRGASSKVTLYDYDSGTGTMSMSTGNGLRTEILERSVSGGTITETRTIQDSLSADVSVVKETKTSYPFGDVVTQRELDPAGADLTSTFTYYDNAVTDAAAYGQLKLAVEATGKWTRYTYDSEGRAATTGTQFGDNSSASADNLNRVVAKTYGTLSDEDGDSTDERIVTTVTSLAGTEISRDYEVIYSKLRTVDGEDVERRQYIRCTVASAAWDATTNLVTERESFISGPLTGSPVREARPDDTLTLWTYDRDTGAGTLTTTTDTGEPGSGGTSVVAGTRTIRVDTLTGREVSKETWDLDYATGPISSESTTTTDDFGRPTRVDFLDGTYELRSYNCCDLESVTDREGAVTSYEYDDLGRLYRVTRDGITEETALDPEARTLSITRIGTDTSEIVRESHHYDLAGRMTWTKDALNRETTFAESFDGSGHLVRTTTHPDSGTVIQTFYQDGSPLSITGTASPQQLSFSYGVDADGEFTQEIHLGDSAETTEWIKTHVDFAGREGKKVYADSSYEETAYNALGQLESRTDADGIATLYAYNTKGELTVTAIDVNNNGTIDYAGTDRIRRTTTEVVDVSSTPKIRTTVEGWVTDASGTSSTVEQTDALLNDSETWQTVNGHTTHTQTVLTGSGGKTVTTTLPSGVKTIQTYTYARLTGTTTQTAASVQLTATDYTYDAHHRLYTAVDARNGTTTYTYFDDDQIETVTTPDPDDTQSGGGYDPQTTTYSYDNCGRRQTITLPDSAVTNYSYWPTGLLKRTWGGRNYPTENAYDSQGRLKTLTTWKDYSGNTGQAVTTWNYTSTRGFLQNKRYDDNTGPSYTYYPSGRIDTRTWARGTVTTYSYDGGGLLSGVDYADSTPDVTVAYDRLSRPKTITDASGTRTLAYDGTGDLQDEDYTTGVLADFGVHRTFDTYGRRDGLSVVSSASPIHSIGFSYDAGSRLDTVTVGSNTAQYAYATNSNLVASLTFKHSGDTRLTLGYTQDHLNRVGEITVTPSVSAATSYAYTYNAANQRTRLTREDDRYWAYGYDSLGQVESAEKHLSNDDVISGTAFASTYDDIGNRATTTRNGHSATYTANALNQYDERTVPGYVDIFGTAATDATVTVNGTTASRQEEYFFSSEAYDNAYTSWWTSHQITGLRAGGGPGGVDAEASSERHAWLPKTPETFTHDADGNLLSDGRWTYTWDGENRLIAMETNEAILPPLSQFPLSQRTKLEFAYDSNGRRISKQVSKWSDSGWSLEHSTLFVYDGWNMIAELDALNSNTLTKTYAWGLDLSGTEQGAGGVGGLLMASSTSGPATDCAAAYDANGNVVSYVSLSSGTTEAVYEYGAFGETILADGEGQDLFPFRFSTKFQDQEPNFYYYGLRYYGPATGRFLSRDPIEEQGGANLYGFAGNHPTDSIDPFGDDFIAVGTRPLAGILGIIAGGWGGPANHMSMEYYSGCAKEGTSFTSSNLPQGATRKDARELLQVAGVYSRVVKNMKETVGISFIYSTSSARDLVVIYAAQDADQKWQTIASTADSYAYAEHGAPGSSLKNWPNSKYGFPAHSNNNNSNTFARVLARSIGKNADVAPGFHPGADAPAPVSDTGPVPQP